MCLDVRVCRHNDLFLIRFMEATVCVVVSTSPFFYFLCIIEAEWNIFEFILINVFSISIERSVFSVQFEGIDNLLHSTGVSPRAWWMFAGFDMASVNVPTVRDRDIAISTVTGTGRLLMHARPYFNSINSAVNSVSLLPRLI